MSFPFSSFGYFLSTAVYCIFPYGGASKLTPFLISSSRAQPRLSPFDFDLQSQTFPQLCLQVLPPPPSLFSAQPFASPNSFPLEPPGLAQLESVRQNLCAQIEQWKADQLTPPDSAARSGAGRMSFTHNPVSDSPDLDMISNTARQHEEMTVRHLDLALKHWMALPRAVQQETWQLEITRAFAREVEKRKKTDAQLLRVQQEANQLRAQVDRLGSCQWPREFAIFPPDTLPIPRDVAEELDADSKANSNRWDFDSVVAKWKRAVMHDKGMGRSGTNHSHNAAVIDEKKNNNNKRGSTSNSNNANRSGSSRVAAMNAPPSMPNSPLEAPRQNQQASYPQESKRNSALGPRPKRQRLNGQGKNTGNDNLMNGAAEQNSVSRSVSSPNLAQMPPPHPRPANPPSSNITQSSFRHYKPANANGDARQDTNQMDVDSDEENSEHDGDRDGDGDDEDGDGEADADGDPDNDEEDPSAHDETRGQHPNQQNQQPHGGGGSGSGGGNFDGPRVLMDMRARGVQSQG